MMREHQGLMHGVICPLVVRHVDRFVGPNIRITDKICRRDRDASELRDVINCSEPILRPLGVVGRFVMVSTEIEEGRKSDAH